MKRFLLAGLSLALLLVLVQAGAAKPQPNKMKQTAKPIWTLAMDGSRVAYISGGRVHVWNVTTGATSVVKGKYPSTGKYSKNYGEVAIAGKRVALITRFVIGNTKETSERLYTAPVGGWAHQLKSAFHSHNSEGGLFGGTITGVVGSGNVLAVSSWKANGAVSTVEQLSLVTPTRLRAIVTGPDAIVSESADGGRIAVLTPGSPPTVGIYSAGGKLLHQVIPAGNVAEIALSGNRLVVLPRPDWSPVTGLSGGKTLEVYDWTTGALVHTWPVAASTPNRLPGHLAVYRRLAVYAVDPRFAAPRTLHLLDLTTGKDVVIARATGSGYDSHDAAIGPRGFVYAVNNGHHGKLVFAPMAKLLAMVS